MVAILSESGEVITPSDSAGMNRRTGRWLRGWAHVTQSIEIIVTTAIRSRVMRREFGGEAGRLIDANMNDRALLAFYSTIAVALLKWEPRFELTNVGFDHLGADGATVLRLVGTYYPRGHLGDRSASEQRSYTLNL